MSHRLKIVIASILDIPSEEVGEDSSPETLSNWDSVKQIDLMLGVEDEFRVRFTEEEIATLTSYASIREALLARGAVLS
jgi:acyl carrier protein